ncbi:MAG: Jag N-terminal domain-containing protein, partial [Acetivibrio sp.]
MGNNWEEFTARSVSDALTEASVSLNVTSAMLEYEVIEESKSGVLGFFSRPAKIKVRIKTEEDIKAEEELKRKEELKR